ncbi:hypothetical protein [Cyclobacterium plantarum]|uniref:Carboxypeptidase regulatory-like domain-containing protein n=1 Tax=Cyclobacterium plantarum TaxID=2716263 RepID=A0ABX0HEK0_9BACT|nr:hypothetical protein [Cyclobacterium plantarum]NHE58826.1 hypothetical protein [Cyclobacterium plantarum]
MKTTLLTLLVATVWTTVVSQQIQGEIRSHPKKAMDMVLMPFGLDHSISTGTVDKNGAFSIDLGSKDFQNVPQEVKSMFMSDLYFSFHFNCGDGDDFGENHDVPAARVDYVRLLQKDQWAGTVFLVSEEKLIPWLEDEAYNPAVVGKFWEVVYLEGDLKVNTSCTFPKFVDSDTNVEVTYAYQLDLKPGFNWVEYQIEEVHQTEEGQMASFPSKVNITNLSDPSEMLWIGKYY